VKSRHRRIAVFLAAAGIVVCLAATVRFFLRVAGNRLPWHEQETAQEHYLAVGGAFGDGFVIGFFLCFFLILVAIAVGTLVDERRKRQRRELVSPRPSPVPAAKAD
jgi:hypothetical protein